jgi:ABC-type protease/lipase transport system fused ATPase/permease subunit
LVAGVNFSLEPGDAVGIIGPSGSGKSTLVRALVGVWRYSAGAVRLDGARIDQWTRAQWGEAIGYMPQDVELFAGTVTENIARFDPNADPKDVVRAAQRANVHDMILRLPNGYMTELGEGGTKLSAGERQRIALARALYGNPVLLVLDEPNSNLDTSGETALSQALLGARKDGVTIVIVSHRPASLQVVNKLLCLHEGRQVALGPRDEILRAMRPTVVPTPVGNSGMERLA